MSLVRPVVIFDASMVSSRPNGISNDSSQILESLSMLPFRIKTLRFKDQSDSSYQNVQLRNTRKFSNLKYLFGVPETSNETGAIFFQNQLNSLQIKGDISTVVRIHDLFPLLHPEWFRARSSIIFRRRLRALDRKTYFICNSRKTATELLELKKFDEEKIFVLPCLPNGTPVDSCGCCSGCLRSNKKNFGLAVGTIEPRKNLSFLIDTWAEVQLQTKDSELLIIGRYGWKQRKIKRKLQKNSKDKLFWLSDVCDGALRRLMKDATFFVSTSIDEGFNIPAAEACLARTQLFLSDIDVHRELHPNAMFFSLEDNARLKALIVRSLSEGHHQKSERVCNDFHPKFELEDFQDQLYGILSAVIEEDK